MGTTVETHHASLAAGRPPAGRSQRPATQPGRFQSAAHVVHDLLGWLLAASATVLAASGQVEYAITADITDLRRFLVPAILEIAAIFLILGGYLRACDGDSPTLLWLLACVVTGFATWTNLTHGGPRAGRIFAAATVVTFVLWLLKLRDRYRAARRANGLIDAPTAKFRLIRWIVMPRLTGRAWLLAVEYSLRDAEEALHRARVWHDTRREAHTAAAGNPRDRRRAGHRAADLAVRCTDTGTTDTMLPSLAPPPPATEPAGPPVPARRTTRGKNGRPGLAPQPAHQHTTTAEGWGDRSAWPPVHAQAATAVDSLDSADGSSAGSRPSTPAATSTGQGGDSEPANTSPATGDDRLAPPPLPTNIPAGPLDLYQPSSEEDAVMYRAWLAGLATGRELTGADLARAAGRTNDSAGTGRKAARRYRDTNAANRATTGATRRQ
jgi:hypothetical protein